MTQSKMGYNQEGLYRESSVSCKRIARTPWIFLDSATVSKSTLRIMSFLPTIFGWTCKTDDVKASFSQSHITDKDILLKTSPRIKFFW